jgi:hypothetical protein
MLILSFIACIHMRSDKNVPNPPKCPLLKPVVPNGQPTDDIDVQVQQLQPIPFILLVKKSKSKLNA